MTGSVLWAFDSDVTGIYSGCMGRLTAVDNWVWGSTMFPSSWLGNHQ